MDTRPLILVSLCASISLAGCGAVRSDQGTSSDAGVSRANGAFVLTGRALDDGPGDLLNTMRGKVPNFRVRRMDRQCPQITLRNATSFRSIVNPYVFVDGVRTSDTCVLESLRTSDVDRVEVYPMGFTNRPGYDRHAHGLILVFMRGALSDASDRS